MKRILLYIHLRYWLSTIEKWNDVRYRKSKKRIFHLNEKEKDLFIFLIDIPFYLQDIIGKNFFMLLNNTSIPFHKWSTNEENCSRIMEEKKRFFEQLSCIDESILPGENWWPYYRGFRRMNNFSRKFSRVNSLFNMIWRRRVFSYIQKLFC
jgi:hypothetical protein